MNNTTELMFNFSNTISGMFSKCQIGFGEYDAACVYNHYCSQFNGYFVHTGIAVVAFYLLSGWFLMWFMSRGYKLIDWDDAMRHKFVAYVIGDMRDEKTRDYWDRLISDVAAKFAVGFAAVVVYFSLYMR